MRKYTIPQNMTVEYMLGDHLGSTSLTADVNGAKVSEIRYKAWGEVRYAWTNAPANTSSAYQLTRYTFTGQYAYLDDLTTSASEGFGLMFYVSRLYDPVLGRFVQADSIVPAGAQGLDRYAYVNNNPLRFTDPSGHYRVEEPTSRRGCRHPLCNPNAEDKPDKPWHLRRTIFLGSYYIEVSYPSVEDEYEEFHLLNDGEWIASFLDMLAKGLSYLKPNSEPAANLLIYLLMTFQILG